METKDFVLGYGAGKNSAVREKIVEEVDAWLDEHITNPDSPPLDRSLTSSSAAAPADLVGDISDTVSDVKNTLNHKADVIYDTASGDIASFPDGADGLPVKDLTVTIEPVQSGTGDPSPTNVRPISGWTGANVTRTGKNLCDDSTIISGYYTPPNGEFYADSNYKTSALIPVMPNTKYIGTIFNKATKERINSLVYTEWDADGNYIQQTTTQPLTTSANTHYVRVRNFVTETSYITSNNFLYQFELSSTATAYEPFGTTIPISWQSSAGTVYGGTLDVTSGVLTVDMASVDLGTLSWNEPTSAKTSGLYRMRSKGLRSSTKKPATSQEVANAISSIYPTRSGSETYNMNTGIGIDATGDIVVYDPNYNTEDSYTSFATFISGQTLVYELATPLVIQLDPVTVNTLLGQNNIWADCGPSTVEYPCDTKLYIQKINAPTDDDMIADVQIASGKYFIVNNNLYLSTTTILAGDPIKPGTNCTLTNLAAALNAINS